MALTERPALTTHLPEARLLDALNRARAILSETRELILEAFQKDFDYRRKADQSWVTDIDFAVENLLRERLRQQFPDYGLIGEEYPKQNTLKEFTWVIDPIDGTSSLRHRIPLFGTILSLLYDGRPVLGLIDLPMLGRLYSGGTGLGVWCDGRKLGITDIPDDAAIKSEAISVGSRTQYLDVGMPEIFDHLMQIHPDTRTYSDCFGHALVLEGALGALCDFSLRVWDIAATQVLVEEAGGKFFCWRVRRVALGETRYDVIIGKPRAVDWIIRTLDLT